MAPKIVNPEGSDERPPDDQWNFWSPDKLFPITSGFKKYPKFRDKFLKNPFIWLEGKRLDDDIGNLWRIHDKLYDLSPFVDKHPGGKYWLEVTRGTDITENFMTTHFTSRPDKLLNDFYVKDAEFPRVSPYTFHKDGFYMTLKEKVKPILKEAGTGPTMDMYLIQDSLLSFFLFFLALGASIHSITCIVIASFFLSFSVATSHNFFHQKDNWRMYIFDLMLVSSREWRISHAISHHNFPNTIYDYEISSFEPYFELLPKKNKNFMDRYIVIPGSYLTFVLAFFLDTFKRICLLVMGKIGPHWSNLLPVAELLLMMLCALDFFKGFWLWLILHACANLVFLQLGITAAHHHPKVYHEGDVVLEDKDFGLNQISATRDRGVIMSNLFLTCISFGNHTLHHLFPTVDHSKLPLLFPAFQETCEQFNIDFTLMTIWDLVKGFYQQLAKIKGNKKPPKVYKNDESKTPILKLKETDD